MCAFCGKKLNSVLDLTNQNETCQLKMSPTPISYNVECLQKAKVSVQLRYLKLIHTATPDTTHTGLFCHVWCGGVNWVGPTARQTHSVSGLCRSLSGGAVRPPDALGRRTHLSDQLNSHRLIRHRQDRLVLSGGRCANWASLVSSGSWGRATCARRWCAGGALMEMLSKGQVLLVA